MFMRRIVTWGGIVGALTLLALILVPVIGCGCSSTGADRVRALTRLKKIGIATDLYARDWDDRYPPAAAALDVQACIRPYLDNTEFAPVDTEGFEAQIYYNSALTGVSRKLPLSGNAGMAERSTVPVWYMVVRQRARNMFGNPGPWGNYLIVHWADSSTTRVPIEDERFWNGLSTTFSR